MQWFGPAPFATACLTAEQVPTPATSCGHCDEPFDVDDVGFVLDGQAPRTAVHQECMIRMIVGSIGHQMKLCSCFGGTVGHGDPEGLTRRAAARAAMRFFHEHFATDTAPGIH